MTTDSHPGGAARCGWVQAEQPSARAERKEPGKDGYRQRGQPSANQTLGGSFLYREGD